MRSLTEIYFGLKFHFKIDFRFFFFFFFFFLGIVGGEFQVKPKRLGLSMKILFNPSAPIGERGAEGMRILVIDKPNLFGFTWNSPPTIPKLRGQRTAVFIYLESISEKITKLTFINNGYGLSSEWQESRNYFLNAWGNVVLPRLKYSLENKPMDWEHMPDLSKNGLYKK